MFCEGVMDVDALFVADCQAAKSGEPRHGAFHMR